MQTDLYNSFNDFRDSMILELAPETLLEKCLADEIIGASWRLRLCAEAEVDLDPFDENNENAMRRVERTRAAANSVLHRCINQLRKLQTEREIRFELSNGEIAGLAVPAKPPAAPARRPRNAAAAQPDPLLAQIMAYVNAGNDLPAETWEEYAARTGQNQELEAA
jgi:hypothetical protein